ncbi:hypothetical protein [Agreia sp. COWG]|uniref:hypothetical protein n=1 Tax=Agreia sp. COWG TaxID=2773266 RepID=UPI0019269F9D|nr:hypothetical protein [Agreia sp. COWG]CAD5990651.1 conserved exported protein of unknown function [Agreia sp. COWG]
MITHRSAAHRPSRRLLTLLAVGGALSTSLLSAGPAFAAAPASSAPVASQSCWQNVDTGETGCFDTGLDAHEQIEIATGLPLIAVETEHGSTERARRAASASSSSSTAAAATYLLMTGWDGISKTGDSKSYFTSNANVCNTGLIYGFAGLATWNDRFESIQSFNGCRTTLYDDIEFEGAVTAPIAESNDLGTFRNRASSLDIE